MVRNRTRLFGPPAPRAAHETAGGPDAADAVQVYRWLRGCALAGEAAERLAVEVARRAAAPAPACVAAAPPSVRLQFLTAQAVLRSRDVL